MKIDRARCLKAFEGYVAAYDPADPKIALKVEHTYRVAGLAEGIAADEGLAAEDIDLAWLCGLLHDIGRFEQVRRYGTFSDARSESHAALGVHVLLDEGHHGAAGPKEAHLGQLVLPEQLRGLLRPALQSVEISDDALQQMHLHPVVLLQQGGAYAALWSAQQALEHYGEEAAE